MNYKIKKYKVYICETEAISIKLAGTIMPSNKYGVKGKFIFRDAMTLEEAINIQKGEYYYLISEKDLNKLEKNNERKNKYLKK